MTDRPASKRKWIPLLLIVSLALNLLVVGMVLGTAMRFKGTDRVDIAPNFGPALFYALPRPERKVLSGELSSLRGKGSQRRKQDFSTLSEALRVVPFDPVVVQALLEQQAQATVEVQEALHQQWLARVSGMSDDERAKFADRLEDVVKHGPRNSWKRD